MNSSSNTEDRNGFEDINSTEEQVDFNSMDVYPPGSDVTVFYTLGSRVSATPNDWIGIFLNGFRDTRHPLTFQWTTKSSDTITTLERNATFSNKLIQPLESFTLKYQFAYINKKNEVLGLSRPFMIKYKESWDLDMELYETIPKGDSYCSLDGPLALSESSSGSSESPVLLSIDEDWEFTNDSPCNKHTSLSDLSDIVVLSTSPSKESTKTEAQLKDDTLNHADKDFPPICFKRKTTLPCAPTSAEGSLSENVSLEREMQITEAGQETAETDEQLCDKQGISVGNKGIKTEGLSQICTKTKRDRRKKSKKQQEEIVSIEHNPSSFVDRFKLLGDESISEEESSESDRVRQDRKILIEVLNGRELDCCQSKVSQAKQNKKCKKRKNKKLFEPSQQIRENCDTITECTENDKKCRNKLHQTMSSDHSSRLKKSRDCNVSQVDVSSQARRTSRKHKSRKTETVEHTVSQHNAEIIDEIFNGKEICLNTEQGNARQKKDIQKERKSEKELKENLITTDVEKLKVVHIPGEELKALKKKYCSKSKTKRNKQQHIRKKTEVFCNLQNLFAEIGIEEEAPVPESQDDCPKVERVEGMSSSLLKDVSDQGFPALPSQHNTPPELVKVNSQLVACIGTDITAPEVNNKGSSQDTDRGLALSSSSDSPTYIPAYLLDIMDALPPPRGNNDVKDLKECDNMLLHKTSKSVLQAFKAKYKVKSARKSELQKMKLRSKYFYTKSGIVDRIRNHILDPNCNLQKKDNTWKFFQEPEECLAADVSMDGPQTVQLGTKGVQSTSEVKPALVPSCQGSTSEVKPALVPSSQGSTSEVKPVLVPSYQGSTSEVKPALVPSCQGSTSEVKPALVPSCQGSTSEVKPALVPSSQGSTSEVKPVLVPSYQGSTSEVKPVLVPSYKGSTSEVKPALVPSCQGSTSEVKPVLVPSYLGSTSEVKRTSYANVVKKNTQDTKELVGNKVQLQPNDLEEERASTCATSYINGKAKRISVVQNNNRTRSTALRTLAKLLRKRARDLRENKICVQDQIICQEKSINAHIITPQDIGLKISEQIGDILSCTAERQEICNVESTAERQEICNVESTAERQEICNVESSAERQEICNVESTAERQEIFNVESTAERQEIYRTIETADLKKSNYGDTKKKDAVLMFRPAVRTPTKKAFHSCRSPPKREIEASKDTKREIEEISWEKGVEKTTVSPLTMWSTRSPLKDKVESVAIEEMRRVKGNNIKPDVEHVILNRRVAICKWAGQVKSLVRSNTEIFCLRSQVKENNQEIISLQNQVNSLKEAFSIETKRLAKANMKWLKLKIKYKELKARKIEDENKDTDKLENGSVKKDADTSPDTADRFKSLPRKRKRSLDDPSRYGYANVPSIFLKDELNAPPHKRRRNDNFPSGNHCVKENTTLIQMEPEEANRVYASQNHLSQTSTPKHYNFFCPGHSCRQESVGVKIAQTLNHPKYVSQTRASFNGASSHFDGYSPYCVQSKTSPPQLPLSNLSQAGLPKISPPHLPLPFPNQMASPVSPLYPVYPNAIYPQSFSPPQEAPKEETSHSSQATPQYRFNYRNPLQAQDTCLNSLRENYVSPSRKHLYTSMSPSYRRVSESVPNFNQMVSSHHPRPTCSTTNDATTYQHCPNPHVLQHPVGQACIFTPTPTCGPAVTAVHDACLCWNRKAQVAVGDHASASYLTVYAQEGASNRKEGIAGYDGEHYRLRADASEKPSEKNQVSNNFVLLAAGGPNTASKCNVYPIRHVYELNHPTYQSTKLSDNSSSDREHKVERMFEDLGKPEIGTVKPQLHQSDLFFQSHFLKQLVKDENMNHVHNAKQTQYSSKQSQVAKMLPFNQYLTVNDTADLEENYFRGSTSEPFCRKEKPFYEDGEQKYLNDQNGYVPFASMTENCLAEDIDERKVQSRTQMLNWSNKQKLAHAHACKQARASFENTMSVLELSANDTIGFPREVLSSSFCHHKDMMCDTCASIFENNLVNRPIEASGACHKAF